ncbi:hexosaminidase D-like [Rhodnius prolixus]|uniref:Beta-N-acetylhexosaminidase n=1 Tax=Rhodnius prolixus TaxID=13249 RepID=T1HCW0_RHOPR
MELRSTLGLHRLVHFDLKRAPIKVDYFEKLFPVIHDWGATGVLIEWEDTFPYSGEISVVGSSGVGAVGYKEDEVERIYKLAEENELLVVPLVQTFGHLEFVLRHEKWAYLREVSRYPSSLCPSHPDSLRLVTTMIDQVIEKAPVTPSFFHIGADEVWHMGMCSICMDFERPYLLMNHLISILSHIQDKHPGVRPIMWDDMLRTVPTNIIKEFNLGKMVDPMVWFYEPAQYFQIPNGLWEKYADCFGKIWVASAFKGATGPCQVLPVIQHHVSNHEQWLSTVSKLDRITILGIAITGWSRYDHYATLCELLPAALPSLALCLKICTTGTYGTTIYKEVATSLGYIKVPLLLNPYPRPQAVAVELSFPGWKIATGVEWFANLKGKHLTIVSSDQVGAWMNPWQLKNNFINPMQIQGFISAAFELGKEWDALEVYMMKHMSDVYYDATIDEWLATLVHPPKQEIKQLVKSGNKYLESCNR